MNRSGCYAALCVALGLAGCTGMRATTAALQVPPPPATEFEAPPPPPNPPAAPPSETNPSATSTQSAPPPSANAEVANSVPVSYTHLDVYKRQAQARLAQSELQRGQWRGPLHGIPIALKDLIDTCLLYTSRCV